MYCNRAYFNGRVLRALLGGHPQPGPSVPVPRGIMSARLRADIHPRLHRPAAANAAVVAAAGRAGVHVTRVVSSTGVLVVQEYR